MTKGVNLLILVDECITHLSYFFLYNSKSVISKWEMFLFKVIEVTLIPFACFIFIAQANSSFLAYAIAKPTCRTLLAFQVLLLTY